jgi:hypothetical protein
MTTARTRREDPHRGRGGDEAGDAGRDGSHVAPPVERRRLPAVRRRSRAPGGRPTLRVQERKARPMGLDAPTRRAVDVITHDRFMEAIGDLEADIARSSCGICGAPTYVIRPLVRTVRTSAHDWPRGELTFPAIWRLARRYERPTCEFSVVRAGAVHRGGKTAPATRRSAAGEPFGSAERTPVSPIVPANALQDWPPEPQCRRFESCRACCLEASH